MKKSAIVFSSVMAFMLFCALATAFAADCCKKDGTVCAKSEKGATCPPAKASSKEPTEQDVVIDPVCGMDVKASEAKYSYKYKGKTYHFCSKSCFNSFKKDPSKFLGKEGK